MTARPRTPGRRTKSYDALAVVRVGDVRQAERDRASGLDDETVAESRFREEQERRDRIEDMGAGRWAA